MHISTRTRHTTNWRENWSRKNETNNKFLFVWKMKRNIHAYLNESVLAVIIIHDFYLYSALYFALLWTRVLFKDGNMAFLETKVNRDANKNWFLYIAR